MIAATVANGPTSASAAAADACGRRPAATAARVTPAAHRPPRRTSRDDVILADSLVTLAVMKPPSLLVMANPVVALALLAAS